MIVPVILSGGAGTRLWPLSREMYPKQLLPLTSDRTMLQDTAIRLQGIVGASAPVVVCNESHRFMVAEQLRTNKLNAAATYAGRLTLVFPSTPPKNGPAEKPSPNAIPMSAIARDRVAGVVTSLIYACAVEIFPPVKPSIMRDR